MYEVVSNEDADDAADEDRYQSDADIVVGDDAGHDNANANDNDHDDGDKYMALKA